MDKKDIIIVGGGLAGITAAKEALDQGMSVRLVDRGPRSRLGGLARWAFGGIFYVDSPFQRKNGFEDSPELAFEDWCAAAEFEAGDVWPRCWAEKFVERATPEVYEWLKPMGIKYFPSVQWVERGLSKRGNSVPRFHLIWGSGMALANTLIAELKGHPRADNLDLHFEHKVTDFIISNGRIVGVRGVKAETELPFECHGDAVILAAGGITSNVKRVKKHWYPGWGSLSIC